MSTNDAAAQLASDISSVQSELNSLESKARFAGARSALESFENEVSGLPQRVVLVRSHGYVFEKGLEQQAGDIVGRWSALRATVEQRIDQEAAALQPDLRALELQMTQLSGWSSDAGVAQPMLVQARSSASALDAKISAVDSTLEGMYGSFKGEVQKLTEQLGKIE